jgi:hypothetical protein
VRADSANTTLRIRLGHALTGASRHQEALASYQRAIDLGDRRFRDIASGAVVAAAGMGSYDAALPWLQMLLERGFTGKQLGDDQRLAAFRSDDRFRQLTGQE